MLKNIQDETLIEDLKTVGQCLPIQQLQNSTVFVTGATGLIGSLIVKALLTANEINSCHIHVLALIRNQKKADELYGDLSHEDIEFVVGDITKPIQVNEKIDYIIHGASPTASKFFVNYPVDTIQTALLGTMNICQLGIDHHVKSMIYLSSMEMYGSAYEFTQYATEKDLGYIDVLNVRSCYSEGKRMCENICVSYHKQYGLPVKIARLSQVFGAGITRDENRVFAQFARSAILKQDIILHTDGMSYGNYCYTSDAIQGILLVLTKGKDAQAYNVSNEQTNTTIKDMALMIAHEITHDQIKVIFDIPEDALKFGYAPATKLKLNASKIKKLGFQPTYSLLEMYRRLIRYMENCS